MRVSSSRPQEKVVVQFRQNPLFSGKGTQYNCSAFCVLVITSGLSVILFIAIRGRHKVYKSIERLTCISWKLIDGWIILLKLLRLSPSTFSFLQASYLRISFVLVPDEAQLGVGGHRVVGSDVAVEQGTFHPNRLASQNVVLLQIHGPVYASVHCEERKRAELSEWTPNNTHTTLKHKVCSVNIGEIDNERTKLKKEL